MGVGVDFEKRPSLYELATRSSAIAILGAGGLRYDGASRAGAGTLPPGPTAGHARRANRPFCMGKWPFLAP